jgi:hypothetical protein
MKSDFSAVLKNDLHQWTGRIAQEDPVNGKANVGFDTGSGGRNLIEARSSFSVSAAAGLSS